MSRRIMVVPTDVLYRIIPGGFFRGFKAADQELITELAKVAIWHDKDDAEKNPAFKQLVGYCAVFNRDGRVFAYSRSRKDESYQEKRLQGKISWGIGGHIEVKDGEGEKAIAGSIAREIAEEIKFVDGKLTAINFLGCINDDDDVGKVHLGLLFAVYSDALIIEANDPEIEFGRPVHQEVLQFLCDFPGIEVEGWSRICQPEISWFTKE